MRFYAVIVFDVGKNLLFKSVLGHRDPAELFVLKNTYELDLIRTLHMLIKMDVFPSQKFIIEPIVNQNQSWQTFDLFWANINYVLYYLIYETLGLTGLYLDFQSLSFKPFWILIRKSEQIGIFFFDEFCFVSAGWRPSARDSTLIDIFA